MIKGSHKYFIVIRERNLRGGPNLFGPFDTRKEALEAAVAWQRRQTEKRAREVEVDIVTPYSPRALLPVTSILGIRDRSRVRGRR